MPGHDAEPIKDASPFELSVTSIDADNFDGIFRKIQLIIFRSKLLSFKYYKQLLYFHQKKTNLKDFCWKQEEGNRMRVNLKKEVFISFFVIHIDGMVEQLDSGLLE